MYSIHSNNSCINNTPFSFILLEKGCVHNLFTHAFVVYPPWKGKVYASSIPSRKKMPAASRRPRREASGFGFIMKLRNRCHRGIRLRRWLIKFSGNIPIENCHTGFYIRHQPDQCQIKRKHGKNNPRYKT